MKSKKAEDENKAALDELKKQESEYHDKINDLTKKSTDTSLSTVQKNKAANELQQLKGEDPLPLRKAKINQEATVRKCEKASKASAEQTQKVEAAKHQQEQLVASVHLKTEQAKKKKLWRLKKPNTAKKNSSN